MGAWGTAIFSDDLASDVRALYRDCLAAGYGDEQAEEKVLSIYLPQLKDMPDELSVLYLALAAAEHAHGRLSERMKNAAIERIDGGEDLKRWPDKERKKREKELLKLKDTLLSAQQPRKAVRKPALNHTDWAENEVILFQTPDTRERFALHVLYIIEKPYSGILPELGVERFPLVMAFKWTGKEDPSLEELYSCGVIDDGIVLPKGSRVKGKGAFVFPETRKACREYGCRKIFEDVDPSPLIAPEELKTALGRRSYSGFRAIIPRIRQTVSGK